MTKNHEKINQDYFFAEFGTWEGYSINYFARAIPEKTLHGFDSFFGLAEDWTGTQIKKGHFNLDGKLPKVNTNVVLHSGLFSETLPVFVNEIKNKQLGILHIDSDTYEAANYVLKMLISNINKGTIIIFDEFFGYPNWKAHEFKAWQEFHTRNNVKFRYIAYTQVAAAIQIL